MTSKTYNSISKETKVDISKAKDKFLEDDLSIMENAADQCMEQIGQDYIATMHVPTRDEFRNGIEKMFNDVFNTPDMAQTMVDSGYGSAEQVQVFLTNGGPAYAECMTNNIYASSANLTKIKMGQGQDMQAEEDLEMVGEASTKCLVEAGQPYGLFG